MVVFWAKFVCFHLHCEGTRRRVQEIEGTKNN
jgi:hypothetical protein